MSDTNLVPVLVPALGESVREARVGAWKRAAGDAVKADEPLVELESDKATVDVPAPATGILKRIVRASGETAPVGDLLAEIEAGVEAQTVYLPGNTIAPFGPPPSLTVISPPPAGLAAAVAAATAKTAVDAPVPPPTVKMLAPPATESRRDGPVRASPAMRRMMADPARAPAPDTIPAPAAPTTAGADPRERVVPMSPVRRTIARRLLEAQQNAAILTTFNEINMAEVIALRERYQEQFQKRHGIKLGFMSFFVKAAVDALKAFPIVNAQVRGTDIVYKDFYDIGIAVGGGKGLVVPVVRDADRLSLAEVERTVADLGGKARDNKLRPDDLAGGTFTISNGGIYGSMLSTPLLNPPQSAILGLHVIQKRPVAVGEAIALRPMMYVALSYDHRIIDGREAVQFVARIKECIEDPERILIEV